MNNAGVSDREPLMATLARGDDAVEDILGKLSIDEKVALLSGNGMWESGAVPRLGLPPLRFCDGPHGARGPSLGGQADTPLSPCEAALAATFCEETVREVGALVGEDCARKGCHMLLGPTLNLQRYPISGRHFECYSEDPHLTARLGVAWITGVQCHVAACAKHFVGNDQETDRGTMNSVIDERTLREVYLAPFEASVVEGQVEAIMCGYNRLNGKTCTENPWLLERVLRADWGFTGLVMSDWWGNRSMLPALRAGLNLEMPGIEPRFWGGHLADAARRGQVPQELLDSRCRPVLRALRRASTRRGGVAPEDPTRRRTVLRKAAAESLVLLKNEGAVLPLDLRTIGRVAVIGPNAAATVIQGGGSSRVQARRSTTILDELKRALEPRGVTVVYEQGCTWEWLPPSAVTIDVEGLLSMGSCDAEGQPAKSGSSIRRSTTVNDKFLNFASKLSRAEFFRRACMPMLRRCGLRLSTPEEAASKRLPTPAATRGKQQAERDDRPLLGGALAVAIFGPCWFLYGLREASSLQLAASAAITAVAASITGRVAWRHRGGGPAVRKRRQEEGFLAAAERAAASADAVVLVLGTHGWWEVEGVDQPHMSLLGSQDELVRRVVAAATGHPVVAVLNVGSPKELPWVDQVPGILLAHFGGEELSPAVVDVLLGSTCPAGRLPTTWPQRLDDVPAVAAAVAAAAASLGGQSVLPAGSLQYEEALFVGYRGYAPSAPPWYSQQASQYGQAGQAAPPRPLFVFGHGLSYTRFDYGPLTVKLVELISGSRGPCALASLTVTNVGERAGAEVVQLYVSAPGQPRALRAFTRTASLAPGASQDLVFQLGARALGERYEVSPGAASSSTSSAWRRPAPGTIVELEAAASAVDVRQRARLVLA